VADAAPPTASAGALAPATYDGGSFDLDLAVAVLQWQHEAALARERQRERGSGPEAHGAQQARGREPAPA
jgi:hypothetical protein